MLIVCYYLLAIDSNDNKCTEEGEVFEYQEEEDQGHANQGNPSNFVAYLNPSFTPCMICYRLSKCMILYCYYS
jgi:hypothetical protein